MDTAAAGPVAAALSPVAGVVVGFLEITFVVLAAVEVARAVRRHPGERVHALGLLVGPSERPFFWWTRIPIFVGCAVFGLVLAHLSVAGALLDLAGLSLAGVAVAVVGTALHNRALGRRSTPER